MIPVAEVLQLEAKHPAFTQQKREAIRALGTTPVRYQLRLLRILTDEHLLAEALRTDPTTTHRLLDHREARHTRKAYRP